MKNFIAPFWRTCLGCALFFLSSMTSLFAQSEFSTPVATANGYVIKKTTTNTSVPSGVNFSYTIDFTVPAGATSVSITDVLPSPLTFQAITYSACSVTPIITTPPVGTNGTVTVDFGSSLSAGCAGSICITVQFPNGTTCNGTLVRNQACFKASGLPNGLCTGFVTTTATAANPWQIGKYLIANSPTASCSNAMTNDTARYRFCVYKNVGTTGQLNLFNATVTDVLPAGAYIIPGSATCPFTTTTTAGVQTVTWNIGALSATSAYNSACCDFSIYYPPASFPIGSTITNTATLGGSLGSPNAPCGTFTQNSNTTSFQITTIPKSKLYKWVNTTGQPGCGGRYTLYVCNDGGVTLNIFSITDNLPATLTGYTIVGFTSNVLTPTIISGVLTANSATMLPPGGYVSITIDFTIPLTATVGSTITNCATLASPQLLSPVTACASFVVQAPVAKACVWKEICQKQASYLPNSTFRYRLRVQNIGGLAMTGTTVTDILSPYLTYIGNPTYYKSTSWSVSGPCSSTSIPSGTTAWTGVTYTGSGQNLTWNLPPIAAVCQSLFYTNCGLYGTGSVPYYYIEFDVKVNADAPIGLVPNNFTLSGGNVATPETSNTDYVNIVGSHSYTLGKNIIAPTTGTVAAGGQITYRLQFNPTGTVALRNVAMADLLPRNATTDRRILAACAPRGSAFDITYASTIDAWANGPSATAYQEVSENTNALDVNLNMIAVAPPLLSMPTGAYFASSCGAATTTNWTSFSLNTRSAIPIGKKNIAFYFGTQAITPTNNARVDFKANVPTTVGTSLNVCNSFAANAAKAFLFNSTLLQFQTVTEQESPNVCIKTDSIVQSQCRDSIRRVSTDPNCCQGTVQVVNGGTNISQIQWTSFGGSTVQSVGVTGACLGAVNVTSATTGNVSFSPTCVGSPTLTFYATGNVSGVVSINLLVIHTNGDTCRLVYEYTCKPLNRRCDSIATSPYLHPDVNTIAKKFTIFNLSVPNSPICHVNIAMGSLVSGVFTPFVSWSGGPNPAPISQAPWTVPFVSGSTSFPLYDRIPRTTASGPQPNMNLTTGNNVMFNLGFDKTVHPLTMTYVVRFQIVHCNGDTCFEQATMWTPINPCPTCPILDATAVTDRIFAKQIALKGNGSERPVKYVSFRVAANSEAEIFATSAATSDTEGSSLRGLANLAAASAGPKTALFEFATPVVLRQSEKSPLINMVFAKAVPNLIYTLYDVNGDEIFTNNLQLTTGIIGTAPTTSGLVAKVFPNPAQSEAYVQYDLPQSSDVKIELFNAQGQFIRSLDNAQHDAGSYQTRFNTEGVAKGAYFIRIITKDGIKSLPLMIQ